MKTVTLDQVIAMRPCWLETKKGRKKLMKIGSRKECWNALDVLALADDEVGAEDKLWLVLREDFLSARVLHVFACQCAEEALKLIPDPDPRSVKAVRIKRLWINGKATDKELDAAKAAAQEAALATAGAAAETAARVAAETAARAAAWVTAEDAAREAAWVTAWEAAWVTAWVIAEAATEIAAWDAARQKQVEALKKLIEQEETSCSRQT